MSALVPGDAQGRNRMQVTQAAIAKLLANPAYRDAVNWNFITLCNTDKSFQNPAVFHPTDPNWKFGLTPAEAESRLSMMAPWCATPSTSRYLDALHILRTTLDQPDAYRCQKNYALIFSDGSPNDYEIRMKGDAVSGFYPDPVQATTMLRAGVVPPPTQAPWMNIESVGGSYNRHATLWWAHRPNAYGKVYRYLNSNPAPFTQVAYPFIGNHYTVRTRRILNPGGPGGYTWNNATTNAHWESYPGTGAPNHLVKISGWGINSHALRYFAEYVADTDLKTGGLDAAGKSWDDPAFNNGKQTIQTFAVGFELETAYLDGAATATGQTALRADNEAQLNAAFSSILDQVLSETTTVPPGSYSTVAPALGAADAQPNLPATATAVHLNLQTGSSEIRFYDVSHSGGTPTIGTAYKTPSFVGRKTLIGAASGNGASWFSPAMGVNNAYFDIPASATPAGNADEWRNALVPWINRSAPDTAANNPNHALQYRVRNDAAEPNERNMGDILHSPVLAYGPAGAAEFNRQKYLVTAANDGMLYIFQSHNDANHPYRLRLNYMPGHMPRSNASDTVVKNLRHIVAPQYVHNSLANPHRYLLDGGIVIRSTDQNGPEQIFMAGNMGRGGRGAYAVNLGGHKRSNGAVPVGVDAPDNSWPTSVPLFETAKGATADAIGYTIGSPQIGRVAVGRTLAADGSMSTDLSKVQYAVFMGSGIHSAAHAANPDQSESALYVFNALQNENVGIGAPGTSLPPLPDQPGELLRKIPIPGVSATGGLMQPTLVDSNFDGVVDVAYAADLQGGLYRFDLRKEPAQWTAHKIFQAKPGQKVTAAPAVYRRDSGKYIVVFGTGSDLYQSDLGNQDVQSVYGIYDDLGIITPTTATPSQLLTQAMADSGQVGGVGVRTLSDHDIGSNHAGWFFDLPPGEQVVIKPDLLLRTVLLTTRKYTVNTQTGTPSNDKCLDTTSSQQSTGESWVMQFRVDNGGVLPDAGSSNADKDLYAYVDMLNENTGNGTTFRPSQMYSGYRVPGSLYSGKLSLGGGDRFTIGGLGSAVSINGDSGETGTDPTLQDGGRNAPRQCLNSRDNYLFGLESAQGISQPKRIYGRLCRGSYIRRLSWREIF